MFLLFSCLKLWICSSSASRRKLNDHTLLNITDHYGIWWTLAPWSPCSFFHFLPLHSVILDFKVNVFKLFTTFIFLCIINFFLDCFILYCLLVSNLFSSKPLFRYNFFPKNVLDSSSYPEETSIFHNPQNTLFYFFHFNFLFNHRPTLQGDKVFKGMLIVSSTYFWILNSEQLLPMHTESRQEIFVQLNS